MSMATYKCSPTRKDFKSKWATSNITKDLDEEIYGSKQRWNHVGWLKSPGELYKTLNHEMRLNDICMTFVSWYEKECHTQKSHVNDIACESTCAIVTLLNHKEQMGRHLLVQ